LLRGLRNKGEGEKKDGKKDDQRRKWRGVRAGFKEEGTIRALLPKRKREEKFQKIS